MITVLLSLLSVLNSKFFTKINLFARETDLLNCLVFEAAFSLFFPLLSSRLCDQRREGVNPLWEKKNNKKKGSNVEVGDEYPHQQAPSQLMN